MFELCINSPADRRNAANYQERRKISGCCIREGVSLRPGNYYLIKAEVLDELFRTLNKNGIEQCPEIDTARSEVIK